MASIRIIFEQLHFTRQFLGDGRFTSGQFIVSYEVEGVDHSIGFNEEAFDPPLTSPLDLYTGEDDSEGVGWRTDDIDVTSRRELRFTFQIRHRVGGRERTIFHSAQRLRAPFVQLEDRVGRRYAVLDWRVEVEIEGEYGHRPPDTVVTRRHVPGAVDFDTVDGRHVVYRLEYHPVLPIPRQGLPPRPGIRAGREVANPATQRQERIFPHSRMNVIANPAVIPILPIHLRDENWCPRIEYTYLKETGQRLSHRAHEIEWDQRSLAGGGQVNFYNLQGRGPSIKVYGVHEGEVLLEATLQGQPLAQYRALVRPLMKVPCRVNILVSEDSHGRTIQPRSNADQVADQLKIASRFLYQMGIVLELHTSTDDHNPNPANYAVDQLRDGIFRCRVPLGWTRNINLYAHPLETVAVNYHRDIVNFAYIVSSRPTGGSGVLGLTKYRPSNNHGHPTIEDSGTPSNSWQLPCGVPPDGAAGSVVMNIRPALIPPHHDLCGIFITDTNGNPERPADREKYAGTIAHETGHMLNLGHRVDPQMNSWDGLRHPRNENLMHYNNPTSIARDLDILQARVAHMSPLLRPY